MLRLTTLALSGALALVVVEVALRNIGGIFQDRFTRPDFERGWSLRPSFGGWMGGRDAPLWVTTNSDGMRDVERSVVAEPGVMRIAVLGDSYVQGIAVRLEHTLTSFLETHLEKCAAPGGRIEVLNFGVSGYGTAQELLTWRHHAKHYRPDVVILGFYTGNDVFNNSRRLNPTLFPEHSPYFTLDGDTLVLDASFREHINHREPIWRQARIFLTERFRTAQLLHDYYARARAYFVAPALNADGGDAGIDLDTAIYSPPVSPDMADAWRVTEALLRQWDKEVREAGAEPWLVTFSNALQVHPGNVDQSTLMRGPRIHSLFYPDVRLGNFAAAHRINRIALAEPMAAHASTTREFLHGGRTEDNPPGEGHWNERGDAVAAQIIAEQLCARSAVIRAGRATTEAR